MKILGQSRHIEVYSGESIENVAFRICTDNGLNLSNYEAVKSTVGACLRRYKEIEFNSGRISLRLK